MPDYIPRSPVTSSWLTSIGYHADTQTLAIEFGNARVYHYPDVPIEVYDLLVGAPSAGRA